MNTHKKKTLALAISSVLLTLGIVQSVSAALSTTIPRSALSSNGRKVTICHFPPGNPDNYQTITISKSALHTHIDHHDDVFAVHGACPAIPVTPVASTTGCAVPAGIMSKVLRLLPEGHRLETTSPLLTEDNQANILLKKDANIKVAFVDEGAGYTNSLGFFSFDKTQMAGLTSSSITERIIFPNFSKIGAGGNLTLGDTVDLGTITAGTGVGFTLVSNGWRSNQVRTDRTANQIFRTVKGLNPESTANKLNYHTVLLSDPASQVLVIGIEDLNRENSAYNDYGYATDDDFNDAVLAICVDPFDAIEDVDTLINIDTGSSTVPPPSGTTDTTGTTGGTDTTGTTGGTDTTGTTGGTDTTGTTGTTDTAPRVKIKGVGGRQGWSERTVPPPMETPASGGGAGGTTQPTEGQDTVPPTQ